jgi:hypothetical protein
VLMEDKHLITFESKKIDESPIKKANSWKNNNQWKWTLGSEL